MNPRHRSSLAAALFAVIALAAPFTHAADASAPCNDFDAYVNGAWSATAELPPDRARIGSFDELRVANERLLERALDDLAAEPARAATPGLRALLAHYRAALDTDAIERRGLAAAAPWLARIDAVERAALPVLLGELARLRIAAPLNGFVGTDAKDVRRWVVQIGSGGLGLPDRDDYAAGDAESQRLRAAYRSYAAKLLEATGTRADAEAIDALMQFEATLAAGHAPRAERRDPYASYHPQTLTSLAALAGGFDWRAWLAAYTARPQDEALAQIPLVLGRPAFAQAVAKLAADAPLATWRNYLRVRLLDALADKLPATLADAHFAWHEGALRGLRRPPPLVTRFIVAAGGLYGNAPLAQALGELYVSRAFSATAQARADAMVADIREALRRRIAALPWMSPASRAKALAKLDAMVAQIGAPATWPDYTALALASDDYAGNQLRIAAWATARDLARLGRPVDRLRWTTSPHIVNAFAAGGNRIIFPAGILQPPFFDPRADDAANYGAIGSVIGHEITHHFDDRGRQFDADGNLHDWWTADDAAAYKQRAQRLAEFYGRYEPVSGVPIDGRQTLGENISDLAGIQIAFDGLQIALERSARARRAGMPSTERDGLTPTQRFFVANALIWRGKQRVEALTQQLRTGSHSPGRYRVLGPLTNLPAFAAAFGCKAGDAMVAADPIVIW